MRRALVLLSSLAALAAGGCVAPPKPKIPVVTPPPPIARLTPAKPQEETDWRDLPLTPGSWSYAPATAGSSAAYGLPGAPVLVLRCDPAQHVVTLARPASTGNSMTILTSYGSRAVAAAAGADGALVASFAARDALLDQIAFSRGRFSVSGPGVPTLYLPAWSEPGRVVEDCRG